MPELYIANCTNQVNLFQYRMPEERMPRQMQIEPGSQAKIPHFRGGAPTVEEVKLIVEQHEVYGLVKVDEIDRTKPYVGLCYSNKEIPVDTIMKAHEHNHDVLVRQGVKTREESAVRANIAAEKTAEQTGLKVLGTDVTIAEQDPKDGGKPEVNEEYRLQRDGKKPMKGGRRN